MENAEKESIEVRIVDVRLRQRMQIWMSWVILVIFPVTIGVYLNSWILQWIGFFVGVCSTNYLLKNSSMRREFTSVDDAIAYLQALKVTES